MRHSEGSFFGRRKGKTLRATQAVALDRTLPRLLLDLSKPPPDPLSKLFPMPVDQIRLEIGFGGGEHLLHEASRCPATGFIGVEPFRNGLAKAVTVIEQSGIGNVRLFNDDAALLLDWLPPGVLARIDLLYPDPWPKPRHWRRRFIRSDNLDRLARSLAADGVFRFASDVDSYVRWTIREVVRNGRLKWAEAGMEDCVAPWPDWPGTRYEAKAVREGRRPAYLMFRKNQLAGASAQERPPASGEDDERGA